MNHPVDPNRLEAKSKKVPSPFFGGGKYYLAVLSGGGYANHCRHIFKRASEAHAHAEKIRAYLVERKNRETAVVGEVVSDVVEVQG